MEITKEKTTVQSELLQEINEENGFSDTCDIKNVRSTFKFKRQPKPCLKQYSVDEDGDLVVRRSPLAKGITIEHINRTSLNMVGMQVWRSALLLGDFIIENRDIFTSDKVVLELGAGVGLTGIIAAMYCKEIIFTDINNTDLLSMIEKNININQDLIISRTMVTPLNFNDPDLPDALHKKLQDIHIIIASDVIYDNDITEQFVNTLQKVMAIPPRKIAFIGMEKRYVFSSVDLEVCAPCYEYLSDLLTLNNNWCQVELLDSNFPQYFQYKKVKELLSTCIRITLILTGRISITPIFYRLRRLLFIQFTYQFRWLLIPPATLLNPEEVSDCFATELMSVSPDDERVVTFCDYLVEYDIDEEAKFNPRIWALREITLERTTNGCESFHSKFNSLFTKAHLKIFIISTHVLNTKIQTDRDILINGLNIEKNNKNSAFNKKKTMYSKCI